MHRTFLAVRSRIWLILAVGLSSDPDLGQKSLGDELWLRSHFFQARLVKSMGQLREPPCRLTRYHIYKNNKHTLLLGIIYGIIGNHTSEDL